MGKNGKAIKRRRLAEAANSLSTTSASGGLTPPSDADDSQPTNADFLLGLVSPHELAVTVKSLQALTQHAESVKSRVEMKLLRGAVFDFQRRSNEVAGTGNALPSRISAALSSARHTDALVLLAELRLRGVKPKLGALQRWVRECDAASRSDGSFGDTMVLRVLDAILRATSGVQVPLSEVGRGVEAGEGVVRKMEDWHQRPQSGVNIYSEILAGSFPAPEARAALAEGFKLLHTTPGPERLPPNEHPALLFASRDGAVTLEDRPATTTTKHDAPHIPGAFLLADLLSLDECRRVIGAAEAVGFAPDKPLADAGASVLAHNLYWLADEQFMAQLYKRFLHLVPQEVDGGRVTGLNRRFRVYRYVPGAIYRPHIDGAWPASGTDPATGEYVYDSSPKDRPQWSRLTFLMYLNDDFDNGCTTFFLPSPVEGTLHAYGVKPKAGCALVFGHGDTNSLLHEGSPVEGGAKYVIRTEVLYESSHPAVAAKGAEPNEDGDEL